MEVPVPIRAYLFISLLAVLFSFSARAGEMEPADADVLKTALRAVTGIQEIQYDRVACRWKGRGPAICTYNHRNGERDSFAWFRAARVADVLLKYRRPVIVTGGLEEVSINNFECGASLCIFE